MEQLNMFQVLLDDYKINKPVRLIELFAGYGSQALALKYLGVEFTHWRICEWAVKSIQAYKDIHFIEDNNDYSQLCTKEQLIDYLTKKGISSNYNEPMTYEQIKRLNEKQLRTIYNNIIATRNLVNINQVKAKDLDICDTENYDYIMTYSFPCQDLSLAGLQKGMEKGSSTRSGLLWEVERILEECYELGNMPQILLMENVPQVVGSKNINDFKKWLAKLESLGYSNYCETINAKDYLIPQNRERTFMVSILGDYNYNFPKWRNLKKRLKDLLEDNVDEKYYLSTSTIERISNWKAQQDPLKDIDKEKIISPCITARGAGEKHSGMVLINDNVMKIGNYSPSGHNASSIIDTNGIAPTVMENHGTITAIVEKNLKQELCDKLIAENKVQENDVIRHSYSTSRLEEWEKRGTERNNMCPTLDTRCDCLGVVVNDGYLGTFDYAQSDILRPTLESRFKENNELSGTLLSSGNQNGIVVATMFTETEKKLFTEDGNIKRYIDSNIVDEFKEGQMATTTYPNGYGHGPRTHDESIALNTVDKPVVKQNLRIRKLTPKECFRLMGVKDEDYENVAKNQSNASLYHLAGDSIVTTCLMALFSQLFDNLDWKGEW